MKLNNKGFAITSILYSMLVLFLALVLLILNNLASRKVLFDKQKQEIIDSMGTTAIVTFNYTGNYQTFTAKTAGLYRIELWGAQGGTQGNCQADTCKGGLGGYTSGEVNLSKDQVLYIYVGGQGAVGTGGYNGGGVPKSSWMGGGGATDVRDFTTTYPTADITWNNNLVNRIMVAAGGGAGYYFNDAYYGKGGAGGGLTGNSGTYTSNACISTGGTQSSGGQCNGYTNTYGGLGFGGNGDGTTGTGGGSGYYGGAGRYDEPLSGAGAGGGSSYIKGHGGCASSEASNLNFTNTNMIDGDGYSWETEKTSQTNMPTHDGTGNMIGNSGNGYAKITLLNS